MDLKIHDAELRALIRALPELSDDAADALVRAVEKAAPAVQREARYEYYQTHNRVTGRSVQGIKSSYRKVDGVPVTALHVGGSQFPYLPGQEWGRASRWGRGKPPRFAWPSAVHQRAAILKHMETVLARAGRKTLREVKHGAIR